MSAPNGIDLGDFEPPPVPEARPDDFERTTSTIRGSRTVRIVKRSAIASIVVLAVVGASLWAVSSSRTADSPAPIPASASSSAPESDPQPGEASDAAYDRLFGPGSELTAASSISETLQLNPPVTGALLRARYTGEGAVQVMFLDGFQNVAAQGPSVQSGYDGVTLVGGIDSPPLAAVRVEQSATGSWTLSFAPVATAPVLTASVSGASDSVFRYDGPERAFTFTHGPGASIDQPGARQPISIEEIDSVTTRVTLRTGVSVVTVLAAGSPWTLEQTQ
jgi:hypothetical protein